MVAWKQNGRSNANEEATDSADDEPADAGTAGAHVLCRPAVPAQRHGGVGHHARVAGGGRHVPAAGCGGIPAGALGIADGVGGELAGEDVDAPIVLVDVECAICAGHALGQRHRLGLAVGVHMVPHHRDAAVAGARRETVWWCEE